MPHPQPFVRFTMLGRFGTAAGVERWSTNLKIGFLTDTTDPTEFLADVASAVSTFHTSASLGAGNACFLTELHGAVIGTDGKYVGGDEQSTKVYTYPTAVAGAQTTTLPWPTSMALSLRVSTVARGRGSHGRIYWPCTGFPVTGTTGRWASLATTATAAATFLTAVNTHAAANFGSGACIVNSSPLGTGTLRKVDRVWVGNRPDHQERRENAASELYEVATVS